MKAIDPVPSEEAKVSGNETARPDGRSFSVRKVSVPLFRKYVAHFFGAVSLFLLMSGAIEMWFSYQNIRASLFRAQRLEADAAASKIDQFITEIRDQVGWTTHLPWSSALLDERRFDAWRLLHQVPAITELRLIDPSGREQVRVSRMDMDVIGGAADFSRDPAFVEALKHKIYYGPVSFRYGSEPYMTIAMSGLRADDGVSIADVNLKLIWDVVSRIRVGAHGYAYVLDGAGQLIAHPDLILVLRDTQLSRLLQVAATDHSTEAGAVETVGAYGAKTLTAFAPVRSLGWFVFVETPIAEAYAPLYASLRRSGLLLLIGLGLSLVSGVFLARRMVVPIRVLGEGAARIGAGELDQRISIRTGDELESLGDQFNSMARQLQQSYATLERKVEERTHQLELANLAKSRFLAAASHDLRQPLHALGLFVAQLRTESDPLERGRLVERIESAIGSMTELFSALLDISKLDAGALTPAFSDFPLAQVLQRTNSMFAATAREKGLSFRVRIGQAWVRSDPVLLERILLNLVSNAIRYTAAGGVLVGYRRREGVLRLEVWDTGAGIPQSQIDKIFGEFVRLDPGDGRLGLGLGLAIVDRTSQLLGHRLRVSSRVGKGSCFSVELPIAPPLSAATEALASPPLSAAASDVLIVVIDDDMLVRDGMTGLLSSWGFRVIAADSDSAALADIEAQGRPPDLVISDYHLRPNATGIEVIARLRRKFGATLPGFLISGDISPDRLVESAQSGFHLLHKPVRPFALRAMLLQCLKAGTTANDRL